MSVLFGQAWYRIRSFAVFYAKAASGALSQDKKKYYFRNVAQTRIFTVSKVKIPLVTVFWLASGPATVLADPPGGYFPALPIHAMPRVPPRIPRRAPSVRSDTAQQRVSDIL